MNTENFKSDAEWYCRKDDNADRYYAIFFAVCKKYNINWASATDKEKAFAEEITRVNYERETAIQNGTPLSEIKPSFVA